MTGLRWGILATGGIARAFTSDLRVAGLDVAAVGSRAQDAADAFATTFDIPHAHGSYEALLADPDVDIVYVATPHPMHAANALAALEAGKHVLVEKPFTVNRAEAEAVRALAVERGLLAMEAMWTRYLPHMIRMRELLAEGAIGEVRAVTADLARPQPIDPAHRINNLALGGGALLDLGIYPISFAWDVLGAPRAVHAVGSISDTGADTEVAAVMSYQSGAVCTVLCGSHSVGGNRASVFGTEGNIVLDPAWVGSHSLRLLAGDGTVREEYRSEIEGRGMQFEALAAERLVAEGNLAGDILPIAETIEIMGCLDEIRTQIGVRYPGEIGAETPEEDHG